MQACAQFKREARSSQGALAPCCVLTRRVQVFKEYAFTPHDESARKCFSTSLSNLVDSLSVCAGSDGVADLCLKWPDKDGRLLLQCAPLLACAPCASELKRRTAGRLNAERESDEQGSTVDSCTYAEISCEESSFTENLEGEMTQPRSQFTLPVRPNPMLQHLNASGLCN